MKKNIKWILSAALLILLIAGASLLYRQLSRDYTQENLSEYADASQNNSQNELQDKSQNSAETESAKNSTGNTAESTAEKELQKAPDFTVIDYEGQETKLSNYQGKPVVLNFWASWCYYCKEEMPDFNIAFEKYPDVQFLMVNATDGVQETEETARAYVEDEGFAFPVFFDTSLEAVSAFYITGFPATFFIDKEGYLVAQGRGMLDLETLERGIEMITE